MAENKEVEEQVKKLKRLLEGWRMALLPLKSVFIWEQQWHPLAIVISLTILYFIIWLMDLSTIATFATFGLLLNFVDFIVPIICNTIYSPNSWTGQKEKMFEELCRDIVVSYNGVVRKIYSFYSLRDSSPIMYYVMSISMLLTTAWLASSINNIFLLYILTSMVMLWPGIQHKGYLNFMLSYVTKSQKKSD
ncbi:ADP-ribosylation factor-like protein 6-interacting protein 1 [Aricia agestis]|uniref:ADP-ribosylation factor-like protein 6-interacting protein 1 n=1 Tax=Aricia agestis TaxID=91739 RepID=UPI001C202156|nr:ADP-ribosylation factor-like protein 6-interacting protein 1 [Aricia agestis]